MPVSLPSSGVSINPGGVSLIPTTLDLPAQGVALKVGVSITGGGGGGALPPWLPLADGVAPTVYADFGSQLYWYNGAVVADFAAFLTVLSGTFNTSSSRAYTDIAGLLVFTTGPRFDYDVVTHLPRGILLEGARTNVCLWNRDLTNAVWTASNVTAAKDQTGADGTVNGASSVTATAGNGTILQAITLASSARFQSAYVKRLTGSGVINMTMDGGSTWIAIAVTAAWSQLIIPAQTLANPTVGFRIVTSGDAIAVDFVQNEAGTFQSSAIPTTSGSVTRATDSLVFTPISGWFNAAAGSVFQKLKVNGVATDVYWCFDDNTQNSSIASYENATISKMFINSSGLTTADFAAGSNQVVVAGTSFKIASAWAANDAAHVKDAGTPGTDATVTLPSVNWLRLGNTSSGSSADSIFGTIEQFGYWTNRVSNAGLQALSAP